MKRNVIKRCARTCLRASLAALFCASLLCGCAGRAESAKEGAPRVVSVIFAPYDFTRAIAGDLADARMLLPPGAETHSYEPTPQDIIAIQKCDIFVYVGGESDAWVQDTLESMDVTGKKLIALTDCVDLLEEEHVEGMQEEHEEESEVEERDEHVWTSPDNAKRIVSRIADALCETDAPHADAYRANTEKYLSELDALDAEFQAATRDAARKTVVFGDKFPFRYLADAYGLTYYAAFPGCSTETEPSAATIAFLIEKMKAEGIPVVFHAELSNMKMANAIAEATGAKVALLHACHNVSKEEMEQGETYVNLMRKNAETLKEALHANATH